MGHSAVFSAEKSATGGHQGDHLHAHGASGATVKLTPVGKHNLKWLPFVVFVRLPLMLLFVVAQWLVEKGERLLGMPGLHMGAWFERSHAETRKSEADDGDG